MGRSKRKRPSTTKNVHSDDDDEETTSDSDSDSDKTRDNKHRPNRLTAPTKGDTNNDNGTTESGDDNESESDDEVPLISYKKRSTRSREDDESWSDDETPLVVHRKRSKYDEMPGFKGKTKYLLKWEDGTETWETTKKTAKVCPVMLRQYTEDAKKALEVEAIVSRRTKNSKTKYLIKWKDHSKGETWETEFRAKKYCPELVTLYDQEMQMAKRKAVEVEAIVDHKKEHQKHKYLIKWKDHSKGETWETARKTISLCPDILDEFIKDRPEAEPPSDYFNPFCWWYKETKDKPKRRRNLFGPKKLSDEEDDDESDADTEWEVASIVKHRIKQQGDWEFLIRWKGCTANDDTWEAEKNRNCPELLSEYLAEVEGGKQTDRESKQVGKKKTDKRSSKRFDRKPRPVYVDVDANDDD